MEQLFEWDALFVHAPKNVWCLWWCRSHLDHAAVILESMLRSESCRKYVGIHCWHTEVNSRKKASHLLTPFVMQFSTMLDDMRSVENVLENDDAAKPIDYTIICAPFAAEEPLTGTECLSSSTKYCHLHGLGLQRSIRFFNGSLDFRFWSHRARGFMACGRQIFGNSSPEPCDIRSSNVEELEVLQENSSHSYWKASIELTSGTITHG